MRSRARWFVLAAALAAAQVHALGVSSFSPQGEVEGVTQIVAKFSQDAVNFGYPGAGAPFSVSCDNAAAARGQGGWVNAREWVYNFQAELPPGVHCRADVVAGFKSVSGAALTGAGSYQFHTSGPFVRGILPSIHQSSIDEDQVFVLRLSGPAALQSVKNNVWCAVDGLGEQVQVELIDGQPRDDLLKTLRLARDAARQPLSIVTLRCNRRLTPASRVELVYGKGVSAPGGGSASNVERRFAFKVREPFTASFSCERENAQAACIPILPMRLEFSAPVPRHVAEQARLHSERAEYRPQAGKRNADELVSSVQFDAPLPENTSFTLILPPDLKDDSGRALANADNFPLKIASATMPPLARFAAAPFGIVERFAEGPDGPALLPVTLRHVEPQLQAQALQISQLQPHSDAEIIAWFNRVQRYDSHLVARKRAAADLPGRPLPPPVSDVTKDYVEARMLSLLAGQPGVKTIALPPAPDGGQQRPLEVVGIPLAPGFHVLEINSPMLGQQLLDPGYGAARAMVVRTSALVTNLGVHFKLGRGNALAWVTTLDKGRPVAGARVQVSDCGGKLLAGAVTGADGIARLQGLSLQPRTCAGLDELDGGTEAPDDGAPGGAYFVSARAVNEGVPDMAFTWSSWQRGIEPWRFHVPINSEPRPGVLAHTVFDRTLLRAGETVSMKHILRTQTSAGFGLPASEPDTLEIIHLGDGQRYTQPLHWRATATGGRSAESAFAIPPAARLGAYAVWMSAKNAPDGGGNVMEFETGQFRVEEFRLPVLQGSVGPQERDALVAPASIPAQVQINYVSGGPAAGLPVQVSAMVSSYQPRFAGYEDFGFEPPRPASASPNSSSEEEAAASQEQRVIADKLPVTLDRDGAGKLTLTGIKPAPHIQRLHIEAAFDDPNGEVQTLSSYATLWPAGVIAGIRAEDWVSSRQPLTLQALALDLSGKPKAGVPLDVRAVSRVTTTSRKRMVGGFYAYDSHTETRDMGTVCTGVSDARGLLVCGIKLTQPGEIELVVSASDSRARVMKAAKTVWVTNQGELWFGGQNDDRMDVLPEKKSYRPGETARFQVRMPFRHATALIAVEREGIVQTQVADLRGDNPTVALKVDQSWAPNVYVSVLALRPRLREVPWYSFFSWGYSAPRQWWRAFRYESRDYAAATPLVDLSKPAFRLGVAEISVDTKAHELAVDVKADRASYQVRARAQVTITVKRPDGQPAAHAEVALAAVDQALLELKPNASWKLLQAMLQRRPWGVETSTAQMEIIGRRHYGRKAAPAGGDGAIDFGKNPAARELLDTLLLWQPRVQLDEHGQARVEVPLNDALTTFRIVAVADAGTDLFGTGQTSVRTTQDLQIISGLPPLVREGDQFRATLTLRNTTGQPMKVELAARASLLQLQPQTISIPAGQTRQAHWDVTAPRQPAAARAEAIVWEIDARAAGASGAHDALKFSQRIIPAVPLTVQQGALVQLDGPYTLPVAPPAGALPAAGPKRGGLALALQPKLAAGLPGVRDWFARYPYACLEQKISKSIGLGDEQMWRQTAEQLPAYLDKDGLASYFPPASSAADAGSDTLTAWILAATHEASRLNKNFALPGDARARMIAGLAAFAEGRIERRHWSPRPDLDVRKLAAMEALARHGAAKPAMLSSLTIAPRQWPTSAVIDWIGVLKRVPGIANQPKLLTEAQQVLRARLSTHGARLAFSTESDDYWWWLMTSGDVNSARLLLTVLDDPAWKDDLGKLASSFIARQQNGAWNTTSANLWGTLALEQFARQRETAPVNGSTHATLGGATAQVDWASVQRLPAAPGNLTHNTMLLPWPQDQAAGAQLTVTHHGSGKPWLTLQALAALELKAPQNAGYQIRRTVTPVDQADKNLPAGQYSRGDVLRVTLEITAASDMTWVAVTDPVPAGATLLGSGLGRDSAIASQIQQGPQGGSASVRPAFEERGQESYRAYYEFLPKGAAKLQYTLRLNNPGTFQLPPTRVEALYAPEMHGATPNAALTVRDVER